MLVIIARLWAIWILFKKVAMGSTFTAKAVKKTNGKNQQESMVER